MSTDRNDERHEGTVAFHWGGRMHQARILEVTEGGMRVSLHDAPEVAMMRGAELAKCTLHIPGVFAGTSLDGLWVDEVERAENGSMTLRVGSDHPATRNRLWLACEAAESRDLESRGREPDALRALPKVPARGIATEDARLERLAFARQVTGARLDHMQETSLPAERLAHNIEALIGGVEIPVGLAGPLVFRGERASGPIFAPFATTEGALVASATRGATALSRAGGVTTRVLHQRMIRAPTFQFRDVASAALFARWISRHVDVLAAEVRKYSKHAELTAVEPYVLGRTAHVVFQYTTGDAAGQNMTTVTTWHACRWVLDELRQMEAIKLEHYEIEGSMAGDKKYSFHSHLRGRGFRVAADCYVPRQVLIDVLKVTPERLMLAQEHSIGGAFQAGTLYNINPSNAVAAIFTATGQDIACVHESSGALFNLQDGPRGLYVSILLPSLVVGTVGGGTHLPRQREMLQLMGCRGDGHAPRLAEIIAGFCLALDLSTLSATASDQFVAAHERLGRNKPTNELDRDT